MTKALVFRVIAQIFAGRLAITAGATRLYVHPANRPSNPTGYAALLAVIGQIVAARS